MKLKYITFTLENCDQVTVDGKYVGDFYVGDIKSEIRRIACNSMMKMDIAKEFAIEIHKNANKEHFELGCESFKTTVFEVLTRCKDITSVEFELEEQYVEDGKLPEKELYDYFVDWTGDSDYENESQKSYISEPGHLYLVIDRENTIEDYFNREEIDDEETMGFQFEMYDIGNEEDENIALLESAKKYLENADYKSAIMSLETALNNQRSKISELETQEFEAITENELREQLSEIEKCKSEEVDLKSWKFNDEDVRNLFVGDEDSIDALLCEIGKIPKSENKESEIISMDTFKAIGLIADNDNCEPAICLANVNIANTTGRKCPHCGESYYTELYSSSTAVYYPPIYKDGVNINPDRNQITTTCECLNCGKQFTYQF